MELQNQHIKYIKYKLKYLRLKNANIQIGGKKMKLLTKKIKMVEYKENILYLMNSIDSDKLDEFSEFPIGSITKLFTILSILILHQNNLIDIFNPIGKYIGNDSIKNLKIIDIINHQSGLKNYWDGANYGSSKIKFNSSTQVYSRWKNDNMIDANSIGKFSYSNIGYIILGVLIEKITNIKYYDFIKNNILIPLEMNNTGIDDCNITLYNSKIKKLSKYERWERSAASSAGELKSCINDLIKFSKFPRLLNKDTLEIIKNLYIFFQDDKIYEIQHGGAIIGSTSKFSLIFNKKWKIKKIYVKLETIK